MHLTTVTLAALYGTAKLALAAPRAAEEFAFVLMGDSTTATNGGWGDGFCAILAAGTLCANHGKSGASTGGYIAASNQLPAALKNVTSFVQAGKRTLVTVQFGHNDQKIAPPESMGQNLTIIAEKIRAAGGEPVLVTSLSRRNFFSNGTIDDILGPWADETILISQQQNTALLDLHAASMKYVQALGPDASHRLNLSPSDNTHLNPNGETVFARLVADLFEEEYPNAALPIIPNPALSYNISQGIPSY